MRLLRIVVSQGATSFLKVFVMSVYSAWAIKLGFIDTGMNPLFALAIVLLSIYGLWAVVRRASDYLVSIMGGSAERDALPKA